MDKKNTRGCHSEKQEKCKFMIVMDIVVMLPCLAVCDLHCSLIMVVMI